MAYERLSKEDLVALQDEYGSDEAIAKHLGITRQAVQAKRARVGLPSWTAKRFAIPSDMVADIRRRYTDGESVASIERDTGYSGSRISKATKDLPFHRHKKEEVGESVWRAYKKGVHPNANAKTHGIHPNTVQAIIADRLGYKRTKSTSNYYHVRDKKIRNWYRWGTPKTEIAKKFGITYSRVNQILTRDQAKLVDEGSTN